MNVWTVIANMVELIANLGAGAASWGMTYEAKMPEILRK